MPMPIRLNRRSILLGVIPLLHLLIWTIYAFTRRPVGDYAVESDFFGDYVPWSREWMTGHPSVMNGFKGPVYYLLLGGISRILSLPFAGGAYPPPPGLEFSVGKILSLVSAMVIVWLTGRIVQRFIAGSSDDVRSDPLRWLPILSQAIVAANLIFIDHTYRAATDLVAIAFCLAAIDAGLNGRSRWSLLLIGVWTGLAYLTRYNNILLIPAVAVFVWIGSSGRDRRLRLFLPAVGFVVIALPWWIFATAQTGDPFYNRNALNAAIESFNLGVISVERFMAAGLPFDGWFDLVRADPGKVLGGWAANLPKHFHYDLANLLGWPIAVLCVAGWITALLGRERRRFWIGGVVLWLCLAGSSLSIFYHQRFALPMLPVYALGIGGFASPFRRSVRSTPRRNAVAGVLITIVFAGGTFLGIRAAEDPDRLYQPTAPIRLIRDDLDRRGVKLDPKGTCASRKAHSVYWLGLRPATMPDAETLPEIVEALRRAGTKYLFVEPSGILHRPALLPLGNPAVLDRPPAGLRLVGGGIAWENGKGAAAVLYEVEGVRVSDPIPLTPAVARHPTPAGIGRTDFLRFSLGRFYLQEGFRDEARRFLGWINGESIAWAPAQEWVGDMHYFDAEIDDAARRYERARDLAPDAPTVWSRLASLALAGNRIDGVEALITRAMQISGEPSLALLGQRFYADGEYAAAIAPLLGAVSIDPGDWRSCESLGMIALRIQGDLVQAARFFDAALASVPEGPEREHLEAIRREIENDRQGIRQPQQ